jgi:putative DNA primase/helicase
MTTILTEDTQLLNSYAAANLKIVLLNQEKKPVEKEWQERTVTLKQAEEWLESGGNIGLQAGPRSGWLSFIDLDEHYARLLAPVYLPVTMVSAKEKEETPSHYAYIAEGLNYKKFKGCEGKELIAIKAAARGQGHQCVVAPSVHPEKGKYIWVGGFDPNKITRISNEDLERRVGLLAAASLIAKHLPEVGGRHHFSLALFGFLIRNSMTADDAAELAIEAWRVRGGIEGDGGGLRKNARDTAKKLELNEPVAGGHTLDTYTEGLAYALADALGWHDKTKVDREDGAKTYNLTDYGNGQRFADRYKELVRWVPKWKKWLIWDGSRWMLDTGEQAMRLAHSRALAIHDEAKYAEDKEGQKAVGKWAIASQSQGKIEAMLAAARPYVSIEPGELDKDPWLFNVDNGTLDLRTGELKPPDPKDLITKISPVRFDPDAVAPRFMRFLSEIFGDDEDLIAFVGRFVGYSLSGSTQERCLAILHGSGKNGKSTLIELLRHIIGEYAQNTEVETVLAKRYNTVSNDVAALKGARFVSTAEVDKGRRLAESKVKQLTGSDTITARFLFSEPFDFRPEFKLWISTNNRPEIKGTDNAIWDRIRLIPFEVRFEGEDMDPNLAQKLRDEASGVLAWAVRGCLDWQENGLGETEKVTEATQDYRSEMDQLASFIDDECVEGSELQVPAKHLYSAYTTWCDLNDEKPDVQKVFGRGLSARGFVSFKYTSGLHKDRKGWRGVGLVADDRDEPGPSERNTGSNPGAKSADDGEESGRRADDSSADKNGPFAGETI